MARVRYVIGLIWNDKPFELPLGILEEFPFTDRFFLFPPIPLHLPMKLHLWLCVEFLIDFDQTLQKIYEKGFNFKSQVFSSYVCFEWPANQKAEFFKFGLFLRTDNIWQAGF